MYCDICITMKESQSQYEVWRNPNQIACMYVVLQNSVFSVMIDVPYRPSWLKIIQLKTTKEKVHVRTATSRKGEMKVNEKSQMRTEFLSNGPVEKRNEMNDDIFVSSISFSEKAIRFSRKIQKFFLLTSIAWQRRVMTVSHTDGIFKLSFFSILFTVYLVQQVQIQSDFIRIYWAMTTIWDRLSTTRVLTLWWQH